MWVVPDENGIRPGYEQLEIGDELLRGGLVPVASGHAASTATRPRSGSRQQDAALLRRPAGPGRRRWRCPDAPFVHLFVPVGSVDARGRRRAGDRRRRAHHRGAGQRVTAGPDGAEVLVWEMHATVG